MEKQKKKDSELVRAFMQAKRIGKYTKLTAEQKAENLKNRKPRKNNNDAYVILNTKNRIIIISRSACALLGITKESKISVVNLKGYWYISNCENGVYKPCIAGREGASTFSINSITLIKSILNDLKLTKGKYKIALLTTAIIHEGKEIFEFLTKSLNQDTQ